jgi:hypothetical protein
MKKFEEIALLLTEEKDHYLAPNVSFTAKTSLIILLAESV